ncbi:ATP-binding protein [Saccharothrix texasensis]|uniref:Anti-sigma regulatory factor (Ser/Thr protein kinase) n=1 Tax=Saccharothrix texasensis TaxID=103734 RepID=A0A3N1HJS1_9PSEU|nr:ATP-binding protein [Saccharothrix texasensis]ROP42695.1 anti-sigma regulatory factor (Ser/Thr protein kinase) [Saccharothrix texasensis]
MAAITLGAVVSPGERAIKPVAAEVIRSALRGYTSCGPAYVAGGAERMVMLYEGEAGAGPSALDLTDETPPLVGIRRWVGEVLSGLSDDELEDCLLIVTELVSNAYDHGEAPRRVRLRRSSQPSVVRIEVDDAADDEVVLGRSRFGSDRGRGMMLVEHCSTRWAVDRHEHGKTVWAEIDCGAGESTRS